jgi:purine-cytosine permease-like protein
MVWSGILTLLVGAILTFAVDGGIAGIDLTVLGAIVMICGGLLLIAGILSLNRSRRLDRRSAPPQAAADYQTGKGKIAAMIASVVYVISPVDVIPDIFLPIGVVDDATAFTWLVFALGQEIARHSRKRHQAQQR